MTFSELAFQTMQNSRNKLTSPRREVIKQIEKNTGIFSPQTIAKKTQLSDPTSVYRTLQLLADLDVIHPVIQLDGVQYYEKHEQKHHHHAICTRCKKTVCVSCKTPTPNIKGFTNLHHTSVLTGLCSSCATQA